MSDIRNVISGVNGYMTLDDLSQYYNIKIELKQIMSRIEELESTVIGSSKIDAMPKGSFSNGDPTSRVAINITKLKENYQEKIDSLIKEQIKIETYIENVEIQEIRTLMRARFIECKTWKQISEEFFCDRTTPYKKIVTYLENERKTK